LTIPNLITCIRIILVPVFVIAIIQGRLTWALAVFAAAGLSDGADGLIARVWNQRSKLGAYLDPLADKMLLAAAFVTMAFREFIPPWLAVVVISRDVLILLGVLILFLSGASFKINPSLISKGTTCFQIAAVLAVLSKGHLGLPTQFIEGVFWAAGGLTIVSGLHYMWQWFGLIGEETLNH